jgi:pimeloyl-ACP methyl ester carboxylesterase
VERSERSDPELEVTPEVHAADVAAVIEAVGGGSVDLFASSGGAVNALALVAAHPELVRTLVAHEPPLASCLADATHALAACRAVHDTYQRQGSGYGMAHFMALVTLRGPVPADFASLPAPDPARFGMPTEDDGRRDDLMLGSNIITVTHYRPDVDGPRRLRAEIARGPHPWELTVGQLFRRRQLDRGRSTHLHLNACRPALVRMRCSR